MDDEAKIGKIFPDRITDINVDKYKRVHKVYCLTLQDYKNEADYNLMLFERDQILSSYLSNKNKKDDDCEEKLEKYRNKYEELIKERTNMQKLESSSQDKTVLPLARLVKVLDSEGKVVLRDDQLNKLLDYQGSAYLTKRIQNRVDEFNAYLESSEPRVDIGTAAGINKDWFTIKGKQLFREALETPDYEKRS